ncbi:hypothetical protein COU95_02205 [Candidatus Shapirobacteria bacterium CG10_big_fil_rev_8_21_14_0_10_40_9]|uniref:L,D-TPase catalytic domain-containing protein n=1 Tax=Candidatus Shapirobacteria bacterium CG10_big_fil_rev_8_21_14_0_10_40_9 TaxID=1974888 RepID=A0A2M8L3G7_9BACT|nr:MAG: hypothetical protein COU95_02205 [Candidatus Shapirobacteria bacterium CG10_big_fil_rev_8_21_14_0_10_40_9]
MDLMKSKNFFLILLSSALFLAIFVLFLSSQKFLLENPGCHCQGTGGFQFRETQAYFEGKEISAPLASRWELSPTEQKVLGEATGEEKWIEVDLSEQKIRAWEGNRLFLESLVSTGKWARTPTGEYRIWGKFKYAKMSGGSRALHTYYYLPNVPYIMYYQNGFGLHGTYWHNNFGQTMSHGCTNLPTPVAEKLFYWTTPSVDNLNAVRSTKDNLGTRIVIHE